MSSSSPAPSVPRAAGCCRADRDRPDHFLAARLRTGSVWTRQHTETPDANRVSCRFYVPQDPPPAGRLDGHPSRRLLPAQQPTATCSSPSSPTSSCRVIRTRLRAHGEHASWSTLRRILDGQQRVTATFRRPDGRTQDTAVRLAAALDYEHGGQRLRELADRLDRTEAAVRQRVSRLRAAQLPAGPNDAPWRARPRMSGSDSRTLRPTRVREVRQVKALTVHQPWAWAIINGRKRVENRNRSTRVRGRIAIHSSQCWRSRESERF